MLSKTGRRLGAKGLILESTFTPWLYCTNTIQRGSADFPFRKAQSSKTSIPFSREKLSRSDSSLPKVISSRNEIPFEGLPGSSPPTEATAGFEDTTITPSEARAFEGLFRAKVRKYYVGPLDIQSTAEDSSGSTLKLDIGDDEVARLLARAEERSPRRTSHGQLSDPGELSKPLRELSEKVRERKIKAEEDRRLRVRDIKRRARLDEELKRAVDLDLYRTAEKFRRATKDVRVWEILQETLDRVKALDLEHGIYLSAWKRGDGDDSERLYPSAQLPRSNRTRTLQSDTQPPSESSSSDSHTPDGNEAAIGPDTKADERERKPTASSTARTKPTKKDAGPSDEHILPYTLPRHLHRIALHLSQRYPANSLSLSVLPALKALGPTAMALGASTELYNVHLRELSLQYAHAPARLVELLVEMEQGAYEPDGITRRILGGYLYQIEQMEDGKHGPGAQALATTMRMKRDIPNVKKWYSIVNKKRERAVLEEARREAALEEGEKATEDDAESEGLVSVIA